MSIKRSQSLLEISELLGDLNLYNYSVYRNVIKVNLCTDGGVEPIYSADMPFDSLPEEVVEAMRDFELLLVEHIAEHLESNITDEIWRLMKVRRMFDNKAERPDILGELKKNLEDIVNKRKIEDVATNEKV